MTVDQTANFVRGLVSSSVGSGDTSISVDDASIYPDPANGEYNLVLWDADEHRRPDLDPDVEIVRATSIDFTNNVISVSRSQEGTAAVSHPSTAELQLAPTSKVFTDIDSKITSSISVTGNNGLSGGSAELGGSLTVDISGTLSLDSDLEATDGETIWDESQTYIPTARLENESMTIAGNAVSLGGSTAINHSNISNIFSDDHHSKTDSASELTDVSADSVSDAHHSKYTDTNAVNAVGASTPFANSDLSNDTVTIEGNSVSLGGSTSVNHNDLSSISSNDHHSKTDSASELTDVSADSVSNAHHSKYTDSNAVSAVEGARFNELAFDNIEDPGTTRSIGIDDSEGVLFKDSGGNTYPLWNSKYVSGGTDLSVSGGSGAGSTPITISHDNTSNQGNVSTGGATIIDDINLDGRGHVTNLNTQNRSLDDWQSSVDDNTVGFGSNEDFSIFYESATDELVIRDETNSVDLIRQPKAGSTEFIQGADIGSIEAPEDSFTQTINASVTSAATSGDTVGYTFAVDNQSLLAIESTADGSGGISDKWVEVQDDLRASGGEIIWDESSTYIPQGRLQNDSVTIEGNSVSLGGSTSVNHNDLSSISSNDHHSKTSSASELTDVSADSVSDAHHSKYTDSNAVSAVETNNLSSITFADSSNDANNWQLTEDGGNGHLNFTSSGGGGTQMDLEHNGNLRLEGELTEGAAL